MQIELHHIAVDNLHILERGKRLLQNGQKACVELNAHHALRALGEFRREDTDAGANLQHTGFGARPALLRHAGTNAGVDEKILPQAF